MNKDIILSEIHFKAVRSSGPGGQNVNKVASKVVLSFSIPDSNGLTEEEKNILITKLSSKITQENVLIITAEEDRSQLKNKEIALKKLWTLLQKATTKPKARKATAVPKRAIEKRIKEKKTNSEIKNNRKKPNL